jgi:hypothetical protein
VSWLGSFSQERQDLWLPKDDLQDPSSWSSSSFLLLCDIHSKLLAEYNCKEGCSPSQTQTYVGSNDGLNSQDGTSQQEEDVSFIVPSGTKKTHDWTVDQLADLFRTTHRVKTQQVDRTRGQRCGDINLAGYPVNVESPVSLVLDLHITHERFGGSSDPSINGHLHYPNDVDRSLNEVTPDKISF